MTKQTVGFIGVGLMGYGVCRSLLRNGFRVHVVAHRRRDRIEDLVERGAIEAPDPKSLAESVDVLLLCLPSPAHIRYLMSGPDGLLASVRPGLTVFDCTTSDPALTVDLAKSAAGRNARFIDLPLMRGPDEALAGRCNLIVGASRDEVDQFQPLFDAISERQFFARSIGNGHRLKILNNSLSMCQLAAICETFAAARSAGVDLQLLHEVLSSGNANSPILRGAAPKIVAADHPISATIAVCAKDAGLFVDMEEGQLEQTFMGPATRDLFEFAASKGYRDADGSQAYTALLSESADKQEGAAQ